MSSLIPHNNHDYDVHLWECTNPGVWATTYQPTPMSKESLHCGTYKLVMLLNTSSYTKIGPRITHGIKNTINRQYPLAIESKFDQMFRK